MNSCSYVFVYWNYVGIIIMSKIIGLSSEMVLKSGCLFKVRSDICDDFLQQISVYFLL
jgi:hypothetical protein